MSPLFNLLQGDVSGEQFNQLIRKTKNAFHNHDHIWYAQR